MNELHLDVLLIYTGWERRSWFAFVSPHGGLALALPVGSHADGRFVSVRELIAPIFGADIRYAEHLSRLPLTPQRLNIREFLLHEGRHWAQIATLLRLNGLTPAWHDLLVSFGLGCELKFPPSTLS